MLPRKAGQMFAGRLMAIIDKISRHNSLAKTVATASQAACPDRAKMQTSHQILIANLLRRYGQIFSHELGLDLSKGAPSSLFRWLCASLLMSAPISHNVALRAAATLARKHWTTAEKLNESTWEERVRALDSAGYVRFDESAARLLGDAARKTMRDYDGDLRKLRDRAERNPVTERALIKAFDGIGDVGADIFLREVQVVWQEQYPLADRRALLAAARFGLPDTAEQLASMVDRGTFPRLLAALVRFDLAKADANNLQHTNQEVAT